MLCIDFKPEYKKMWLGYKKDRNAQHDTGSVYTHLVARKHPVACPHYHFCAHCSPQQRRRWFWGD